MAKTAYQMFDRSKMMGLNFASTYKGSCSNYMGGV